MARVPGVNRLIANSTWYRPQISNPVYQDLKLNTENPEQYLSRFRLVQGLASFDEWWDSLESVPTHHLVWGRNNTILSPRVARLVEERLKPKTFHWIEEASHLPMAEQPEAFNNWVESLH
jgi:pimeloyl-ACP methyl ester carboxylesterase